MPYTSILLMTLLLLAIALAGPGYGRILHVGTGQAYASLSQAAGSAQAGDTIQISQGTYAGGAYISNLHGTADSWILIRNAPGDSVIFNGGSQAFQLTDPAYVRISGLVFQAQTANGVNIDDGGTYATPAKHLIIENCVFRDLNATGNNDMLKMSGVDSFEVRGCTFRNGAADGSGVDMVGCHNGFFINNRFENQGSNSIQAKGGSRYIRIEANIFRSGGMRAVNLGGSTGMPYFRPDTAHYEAADLLVYSNIFVGSDVPIAYVGCVNTQVVNNTIFKPDHWVIRILQETVDTTRFLPCGNNSFRNNIIYLGNISTATSIGANTAPETFTYSNNLWYNYQNTSWSGPYTPVTDSARILNQDPLFRDTGAGDFSLRSGSPATGSGYRCSEPARDYSGALFAEYRAIGAIEYSGTSIEQFIKAISPLEISVAPSPFRASTTLTISGGLDRLSVYDANGRCVMTHTPAESGRTQSVLPLSLKGLPAGLYMLKAEFGKQRVVKSLVVLK